MYFATVANSAGMSSPQRSRHIHGMTRRNNGAPTPMHVAVASTSTRRAMRWVTTGTRLKSRCEGAWKLVKTSTSTCTRPLSGARAPHRKAIRRESGGMPENSQRPHTSQVKYSAVGCARAARGSPRHKRPTILRSLLQVGTKVLPTYRFHPTTPKNDTMPVATAVGNATHRSRHLRLRWNCGYSILNYSGDRSGCSVLHPVHESDLWKERHKRGLFDSQSVSRRPLALAQALRLPWHCLWVPLDPSP